MQFFSFVIRYISKHSMYPCFCFKVSNYNCLLLVHKTVTVFCLQFFYPVTLLQLQLLIIFKSYLICVCVFQMHCQVYALAFKGLFFFHGSCAPLTLFRVCVGGTCVSVCMYICMCVCLQLCVFV